VKKQHSNALKEGNDELENNAKKNCRYCDKTQIVKKKVLQGGFDSPLSEGCGSCGSTDLARSY
jgi:hypothetical protein